MNKNISAPSQNSEAGISSNAQLSRSLKIELLGDGWRRKTYSGIRLNGRWLTSAGFLPGQRIYLKFISPGVMELRLLSEAAPVGSDEPFSSPLSAALIAMPTRCLGLLLLCSLTGKKNEYHSFMSS